MGAERRAVLSKVVTADGQISTAGKACIVYAVSVVSGAGAAGSVSLENGSGGTSLWTMGAVTAGGGDSISFNPGIIFTADCYADVTGAGVTVSVAYEEIE